MRDNYGVTSEARWVTSAAAQLVRWGSVFAGTIIALGAFILLSALWLALSFANHDSVVYNNLSWWIGGTAIFSMFVAGLIAGVSSGARGIGAGSVSALTTCALVAMVVVLVVVPTFAIGHVPNFVTVNGHLYKIDYLTYWTAFWSLLIGLGAALLGGWPAAPSLAGSTSPTSTCNEQPLAKRPASYGAASYQSGDGRGAGAGWRTHCPRCPGPFERCTGPGYRYHYADYLRASLSTNEGSGRAWACWSCKAPEKTC